MSEPDMARAIKLAETIKGKAETLLRPVDREMLILELHPEMRAIIWTAVANAAMDRAEKCSS
jgi:hypothetical protein